MILPSLHSYTKDINIGAKRNLMLINGLSPLLIISAHPKSRKPLISFLSGFDYSRCAMKNGMLWHAALGSKFINIYKVHGYSMHQCFFYSTGKW